MAAVSSTHGVWGEIPGVVCCAAFVVDFVVTVFVLAWFFSGSGSLASQSSVLSQFLSL